MPVANHPSAAIRKHEFRGRDQKRLELRLDRLGHQPTRAGSQNFRERIVDRPFLSKGDNSILGHGVTLLLGGSGGLITNPVTPPSSHRHPVSRIARREPRRSSCRINEGSTRGSCATTSKQRSASRRATRRRTRLPKA